MLVSLITAIFLILAFPRFSLWPLAWMALLPLFVQTLRLKRAYLSFWHFYLAGFLFFLATWEWLRHVSYFGWIAVSILYALFFGIFGILSFYVLTRGLYFLSFFILPSAWTVLEWIRTEIPILGFGWNLLAYSQASNLSIAHLASWIGAYGISWLILCVNLAFFYIFYFTLRKGNVGRLTFWSSIGFLVLLVGFASIYGMREKKAFGNNNQIRAAVIQGNIPQEDKWDPKHKASILEIYEKLSRFVSFEEKPDLIIWPEAAFPGYFNLDQERNRVLHLQHELKIPILLGSPHLEIPVREREIAYNSAYLVDHRVSEIVRYDKIRLVSFGEYLPWRKFFETFGIDRFAYSLGVSDFEAGKEIKVFSLDQDKRFSILICFEDTFPFLARHSVDQGARFLIVITNDAWFSKSAAPYQHLQASIFRAIENGVPVIRAANTGVSAFVDQNGRVLDRVKDQSGRDIFMMGGLVRSISMGGAEKTFYRKHGHLVPIYCLTFVIGGFILRWIQISVRRIK